MTDQQVVEMLRRTVANEFALTLSAEQLRDVLRVCETAVALAEDKARLVAARPFDEYHEDMGAVLWWRFPISEPPYVGTPLDNTFLWIAGDGEPWYTHWTPMPDGNEIQRRFDAARRSA